MPRSDLSPVAAPAGGADRSGVVRVSDLVPPERGGLGRVAAVARARGLPVVPREAPVGPVPQVVLAATSAGTVVTVSARTSWRRGRGATLRAVSAALDALVGEVGGRTDPDNISHVPT